MVLKNKIKLFLFTGLILILNTEAYPQMDKPAISSGDIQFYMDKAVFVGNESKSYIEFYFMFFADQVKFSSSGKGELQIVFAARDISGKEIARRNWKLEISLSEKESGSKTKIFFDQLNEYLAAGKYNISVNVQDLSSRKKAELKTTIEVPGIKSEKMSGSEIEFVAAIESRNVTAPFRKGDKNIIANASRRYGVLNPILYLYYELYNIDTLRQDELEIKYSVVSQNSDTIKSFPLVTLARKNETSAITHGLNVANIPSGIYNLNIHVSDRSGNSEVILSRLFEVIQKDYTELKTNLSAGDSDTFEKLLTIIGTDEQIRNFKKLSENGKASYILEFWKSVDPSPGTPENEYLQKLQQRFVYANEKFAWQKKEGWSTERGRVIIKYGMPDEIEQHDSEPNTVPYEIWYYRQERGFFFVFGDLNTNGNYILLHSDKEGEISNLSWTEYIRKL